MSVTKPKIIFMGTPDFAVPALQTLISHEYEIAAVYTQPPRPKGRGQKMQLSPVHLVAQAHHIPVHTPNKLKNNKDEIGQFKSFAADLAIVAAYGLILPPEILTAPRYDCINIHASLLPRWRGASPIQHAIWKGDTQSGITIMQMEEGLDTGPIIMKRPVAIRADTTSSSLHDELAALGAAMSHETVRRLPPDGYVDSQPQDNALATYAPMLKKEDGHIDWTQNATEIDRQIRALNPWPGVWTMTGHGTRIKILEADIADGHMPYPPGTLIDRTGHIACGDDTALRVLKIRPDNAGAMDVPSAFNGHYLRDGDVLG